jgi:hypothetical protein
MWISWHLLGPRGRLRFALYSDNAGALIYAGRQQELSQPSLDSEYI